MRCAIMSLGWACIRCPHRTRTSIPRACPWRHKHEQLKERREFVVWGGAELWVLPRGDASRKGTDRRQMNMQ